jgi:hypothetical protein
MLRKSFTLILILLQLAGISYAQQITFAGVLEDTSSSQIEARSTVPAFGDGYVMACYNGFVRVDDEGKQIWAKKFSINQGAVWFNDIVSTSDSCFFAVGKVNDYSSSVGNRGIIAKIGPGGDTIWMKQLSVSLGTTRFTSVIRCGDSSFIVTGFATQSTSSHKAILCKVDLNGNLLWSNVMSISNVDIEPYAIAPTLDGDFLLSGNYTTASGSNSGFIMRFTTNGTNSWSRVYQSAALGHSRIFDILGVNDGFVSLSIFADKLTVWKVDTLGNVVWEKTFAQVLSGWGLGPPMRLISATNGDLVLVVWGPTISLMLRLDSDGNFIWAQELMLQAVDVDETPGKELFVTGNGPLMGRMFPQIGVIQLDSAALFVPCSFTAGYVPFLDSISTTSISLSTATGFTLTSFHPIISDVDMLWRTGCVDITGGTAEPEVRYVMSLYPNPSGGLVNVENRGEDELEILIFNTTAQVVFRGKVSRGKSVINLSDLPAGVYFYSIPNSNRNLNGKLIMQ